MTTSTTVAKTLAMTNDRPSRPPRQGVARCGGFETSSCDSLGEDASFCRADLVVELSQEAQPEQPLDRKRLREVVHVDPKVVRGKAECREPLCHHHVARLFANGRRDQSASIAITRAVTDVVKHVGDHESLRRRRIERESDSLVPAWSPDHAWTMIESSFGSSA